MNVTKLNFNELMPKIVEMIKGSHFVSMDLEMSGIISPLHPESDPSLTDSVQIRYLKTKQRIQKFIPLQLGMCLIRAHQDKVIYNPLNFYLYPGAIGQVNAQEFVFNSESMRFLANNSFDFNQLFYEGVPYLNLKKVQESEQRNKYKKIREQMQSATMMKSPDVVAFINLSWQKIHDWILLPEQTIEDQQEGKVDPNIVTYESVYIDIQHVRLKAYTALLQKLHEQNPSLILNITYHDKNLQQLDPSNISDIIKRAYIKISRCPLSDTEEPPKQQTRVPLINPLIEQIVQNKIPLILHNGYLDLMHIYHRFVDELPADEKKFRQKIHRIFPTIYDTKYICNNNPVILNNLNLDSSLGKCYDFFRKKQEQAISEGNQQTSLLGELNATYSFDDKAHHQAGFDALMTGYTFVNAMKALHKPIQKLIDPSYREKDKFYVNKIPQGNIRIPFNFASDDVIESYHSDSLDIFHFHYLPTNTSKANETFTGESLEKLQNKIQKYFSLIYGGPTKFMWRGGKDTFDFILTFLQEQAQKKFIEKNFGEKQISQYSLQSLDNLGVYLVKHEKRTTETENPVNSGDI